jgi:hypothetical protein
MARPRTTKNAAVTAKKVTMATKSSSAKAVFMSDKQKASIPTGSGKMVADFIKENSSVARDTLRTIAVTDADLLKRVRDNHDGKHVFSVGEEVAVYDDKFDPKFGLYIVREITTARGKYNTGHQSQQSSDAPPPPAGIDDTVLASAISAAKAVLVASAACTTAHPEDGVVAVLAAVAKASFDATTALAAAVSRSSPIAAATAAKKAGGGGAAADVDKEAITDTDSDAEDDDGAAVADPDAAVAAKRARAAELALAKRKRDGGDANDPTTWKTRPGEQTLWVLCASRSFANPILRPVSVAHCATPSALRLARVAYRDFHEYDKPHPTAKHFTAPLSPRLVANGLIPPGSAARDTFTESANEELATLCALITPGTCQPTPAAAGPLPGPQAPN